MMEKNYVGSFSKKWLGYNKIYVSIEDAKKFMERRLGLTEEDLKGKDVLDAGCGNGRLLQYTSTVSNAIGIDKSEVINLLKDKYQVYQMDINAMTFPENHFDVIYSCGVLHHTPSTKKAFMDLIKVLKPGGLISIWVYDAYNSILVKSSEFWRSITTRLPESVTLAFCKYLALTYKLYPEFTQQYLWVSRRKEYSRRVRHNFDWYAPKYQFYHTYYEVFSWFKEAGLKNIEVLPDPVSMRGQK